MAAEVWYPQDVINVLAALSSAGELQGPEYHKALHDVALAFGLETPDSLSGVLPWRVVDAEAVAVGGPNPK